MRAPDLGANLVAMFRRSARRRGDRPFLWAKQDGAYRPWSWRRVEEEVGLLARALADLGIGRGDRVLLVAESRPEWCIADLAILQAGGVTVPAYTSNTSDDHAYLLRHCEAKGVICAGPALAKRLLPAVRAAESGTAFVVTMDALPPDQAAAGPPVLSWAQALARGGNAPAVDHGDELTQDDLACFIYTSGTGGRPKGVMLTHGNLMANIRGVWGLLLDLGLADEVFLSFLPLSHAYEHTAGQFLPIAMGAEIYYAEGVETLSSNLAEVRPTILTCVPRLYEVLRHKITAAVDRQGGWQARLFKLAVELGRRRHADGRLPPHLALADAALERAVRRKVRARFGGRIKALVSGGAPLNPDVGRFFQAFGLPVLQGYGQTEAAPVISVNVPQKVKIETVGPPLDGVEVKAAADGEILVRGPLVMRGYWKDEAATAAALRDGWLHTGDIGEIDEDGYLKITDRKKDIIVNSGGDNIAPARVEGVLLLEPEIGQALVFGDRRPHLVALVVPHQDFTRGFARANGRRADLTGLAEEPAFKAAIGEAVARANRQLSTIERVRKFHVLEEPFSIENGLMTPTLKPRRHLIAAEYRELIDGLYSAGRSTAGPG